MRARWAAAGFFASCVIFAAYWIASSSLRDEPRYGYYSRRFIDFARSLPIRDPDPNQFLGTAAAALGVFHILNPPLLLTTMGHDRFHASETPFWRSDWRFTLQALLLSAWWWWLLGRLVEHRGSPRITLMHIALPIPLLCLAVVISRYKSAWIRSPQGLGGFVSIAVVVGAAAFSVAVIWARRVGFLRLHAGYIWMAVLVALCLVLWPPLVLDEWRPGEAHHYSFFGHSWILRRLEPGRSAHSTTPFQYRLNVARSLLAAELLVVGAGVVALVGQRQGERNRAV